VTLLTLRTLLRRRLGEITADNWTDVLLDELINLAYSMVYKEVRRVEPDAITHWSYRNTVAGTSWYQKPQDTRGLLRVGYMGTLVAPAVYTQLFPKPIEIAESWNGTDPVYCTRGIFVGIFPAPTVSVVNGLEFQHTPTPTLALDTDSPDLEASLQYAIILWACLLAKGESPESDSKEASQLQTILADIPNDYGQPSLDRPMQLSIDILSLPGPSMNRDARDVYSR